MIRDAVASLQAQTLRDVEIIVVDDGSNDGSADAVRAIADPRVRLVVHDVNLGIPLARNSGLSAATGRYIAWLDSDDIALPHRLAVQLAFLEANRPIAMVGGAAGTIRGGRRALRPRRPARVHEQIVPTLLFRSAFQQSSIMGRGEILRQYPYRPEFPVCEDVDMFIRLTRDHRTANLDEVLVNRRLHKGQTIHRDSSRVVEMKKILFGASLARLGIAAGDDELERHVLLGNIKATPVDRDFLDWSDQWLCGIASANDGAGLYDRAGLNAVLSRIWNKACRAGLRGRNPVYAATRQWLKPRCLSG